MAKKKSEDERIVVNRHKCAYCGACISVCNFNANELIETTLVIDEDKCNLCLTCVKICPMNALSVEAKQ